MSFDLNQASQRSIESNWRSPADFRSQRLRKRELLDEQRSCWNEGRPRSPEEFLSRWPTDPDSDPDAASVLLEDILQRRRLGETPSIVEYESRFPDQTESLKGLVGQEAVFRSARRESNPGRYALRLPDVGDEIFNFRLKLTLGQGAFGRVFLAEQDDLAGRPVVIKVTAIEGEEPQTLAQLLHTNIVPIYSLHEDARAGLRAVCMPYLGGATLSAILNKLWTDRPRPTTGRQVVDALESVEAPRPSTFKSRRQRAAVTVTADSRMASSGPADEANNPTARLRELSYERAAAWVVARLADGLHHAHERGILHRDIKPSNILISSEGQPLLLDFNLSPPEDDDEAQASIGGTVAYMSPEHLRALVGRTQTMIRQVDRRSDIYSLGMVLAEMLTGHRPFEQSGSYSALPLQIEAMAVVRSSSAPSLKRERPDISWTLESIVQKCLAPDQRHRYQSADQLAEDLRRLIDDRPLQYAPELSQRERARKFLRRHPRLTSSGTVAAVAGMLLLAVASAFAGVRNQLADRSAREQVQSHDAGLLRALCLVNTQVDTKDNLRDGIAACERTLALFGPPESTDWDQNPTWRRIAPEVRGRLAEDRRELLLLLADARTRQRGASRETAAQALVLLDRAEQIAGLSPSRALWIDRSRYLAMLGQSNQADLARNRALQIPAATARDHYLLATSIIRQGGPEAFAAAMAELNQAIERNPRDYWALTQRGICRLERGEFVLAAADFGQCTGIWPDFAWGYFNRGCVLDRGGDKSAAVRDFTAALDRDPGLVPALVNRGLARLELNHHDLALVDFDRAIALGSQDPRISAGRGIALERLKRYQEADAAFADCFARAEGLPKATRVRLAWAHGFAISARLPKQAGAAFDEALRLDPGNAQAFYGKAMLAMGAGHNAEAIDHFDQALQASPGLIEARRYRAIALARDGSWSRATQEINLCLKEDRRSPTTFYAAACVVALACGKTGTSANGTQALDLLEKAIAEGIDPARAKADPDLASVRSLPRFTQLITRAQSSRPASSPR